VVKLNGTVLAPTAGDVDASAQRIAGSVFAHMVDKAGMSLAGYAPADDVLPVGRCSSCHMPKVAVSGGLTLALDGAGRTAIAEGDETSHVFDIIWPAQSAVMKKPVGGSDSDIMPNSCGKCHAAARLSGDNL
jgi:hypothetical protein